MISSTEFYQNFLLALNEPANDTLLTYEVAKLVNRAQRQLADELFANLFKKQTNTAIPVITFEDELEMLLPFKLEDKNVITQADGFWPLPTGYRYMVMFAAFKSADLCPDREVASNIVLPESVKANELAAKMSNIWYQPVWDDASLSCLYWYRPKYYFITRAGAQGVQMLPHRQYTMWIQWLTNPPDMVIKNTPEEVALYGPLSGTPIAGYQDNPQDINLLWNDNAYNQLMQRTIALYNKSVTDYQAYQVEQGAAATGNA